MLEARHELAVEAAHGVSREEASATLGQEVVYPGEVGQQLGRLFLVLPDQHQLQLGVQVFNQGGHFFVLYT